MEQRCWRRALTLGQDAEVVGRQGSVAKNIEQHCAGTGRLWGACRVRGFGYDTGYSSSATPERGRIGEPTGEAVPPSVGAREKGGECSRLSDGLGSRAGGSLIPPGEELGVEIVTELTILEVLARLTPALNVICGRSLSRDWSAFRTVPAATHPVTSGCPVVMPGTSTKGSVKCKNPLPNSSF